MADRTISYRFTGDFTSLTAGLTAASKSVNDFGNKLTATDRQGAKMRSGLSSIGSTAGKMGLVAAGGLAAIVGVTAKFESAMSRVGAATRASGDDLAKLRQAAIDLGADTIFSATEAADGITELGKAGLSTADILGGGLKGALDLAAAGQISVAEAAETTATTLSQYQLAGSEAARVSDALAAGAGKALGSVSDMAGALKYVGPVASQMGLSLEETTGAIAELASQGILGEQAGTSLRGMLTSLTSPSKAAANQMKALGIEMYDAQGKFVGIDGIAGQLQETLGGLTAAQRDEALGRIFGNEQITAARVLYAGGSAAVQDWTNKVTDSGYAADQAAKLTDNLSGDLEQLKGSLESALIGSGEGSQGPLRSLTQGLTKVVDGFNELPGAAKSGVTGLLAITAVTGGAAWFGAKVIGGIANTKQALEDLGISAGRTSTSLGRVARTSGGLIALAGAVTVLSSSIGDAFGASLDTSNLQRDLEALANGRSKDVLKRITEDLDILGQTGGKITEPLHEVETLFGTFGDTGLDKAANNINEFDQALAGLVESGNADQAKAVFDQLLAAQTGGMVGASYSPEIIDNLMSSFTAYGTALENAGDATKTTSAETAGLTAEAAQLQAAQAAGFQTGEEYAAAQKAAAKALQDAKDAAHDTATSFFNLGDSVNDAKVSLGDWIGSLEKQADALRNFRVNAKKAADEGLRKGLIRALQEAGPEGAMRLQQLANASEQEIGRANKAWKRGQDEIDRYTHAVGKVPTSATTNVNANVNGAIAALNGIQNYKLRDKFITVHTRNTGNPKTGFATGGYTGAGGKNEPAGIVHRGEVVIPADRVKSDWSMLKARYGDLPGFAGGGLVGAPLFTGEGPRYYKAAYRHNKAFAKPGPYQTPLTPAEEAAFEAWVSANGVPFAPGDRKVDYDMRGFWKKTKGRGWSQGSHFPDTYKTPYDTTFSHESKYATADNPFYWHGDSLIDQRNGQVVFAADGATVPKRGSYVDRFPYMLAPGEEIISNRNGQADRFRADQAAGRIPGYASGGTVGKKARGQRDVVNVTGFSDGARDMDLPDLRGMRRELAETNRALSRSSNALDAQTDAVSRETAARDDLVSQFGLLASSIAGQFQTNLFDPIADVWGSNRTMSDPISVLLGDLGNSAEFSSLFSGLQSRGLSGAALTAAAQGGTGALQTLGAYSDADLARYADLYAQREAANASVGNQVAMAQFGQSLAEQSAKLDRANEQRAYLIAQNDQLLAAAHAQTGAVKSVEDATKDSARATASGRRSKVRKG